MKKSARRRIDVNLDELDRVLDGARQAPLSEADYEKVKDALHAMAAMLVRPRNTEKTSAVLEEAEGSGKAATQPHTSAPPKDSAPLRPCPAGGAALVSGRVAALPDSSASSSTALVFSVLHGRTSIAAMACKASLIFS